MSDKILIATLHSSKPVLYAISRLAPKEVYVLISKDMDKETKESLAEIKSKHSDFIKIKEVIIKDQFNIFEVSVVCTGLIDKIDKKKEIYANITSGTKPMAIGLMFACFARECRVKSIAYTPWEKPDYTFPIPKISFNISTKQKALLKEVQKGKYSSIADLAKKKLMSTSMLYQHMKDLEDMGLISQEDGIRITDAGRIVVM